MRRTSTLSKIREGFPGEFDISQWHVATHSKFDSDHRAIIKTNYQIVFSSEPSLWVVEGRDRFCILLRIPTCFTVYTFLHLYDYESLSIDSIAFLITSYILSAYMFYLSMLDKKSVRYKRMI